VLSYSAILIISALYAASIFTSPLPRSFIFAYYYYYYYYWVEATVPNGQDQDEVSMWFYVMLLWLLSAVRTHLMYRILENLDTLMFSGDLLSLQVLTHSYFILFYFFLVKVGNLIGR